MQEEDEELLEKWFLIRNLSSGTEKTYRIAIKDFSKFIGKTPTELKAEADEEEASPIRLMDRKVSLNLLRYKKKLKGDGKSPKTVNLYFSAIKSFYKSFQITLPDIKLDKGDIGQEKNIGKPLTRTDIHKLISAASTRERALIYLMALSGMGQQEARDLTISKLLNSASQATGIGIESVEDLFKHEEQLLNEVLTLEIRRKKVNYRHYTFIPPEVTREIIAYLKERCYGRNEKIRISGEVEEPIFVNNYGGRLSRDSIVTNFRRIGQEAGFKKDKGSYAFWRSHALRKYFISTIINKIGEKVIADYLAGHKISSQDRTYWQANPADLKNHYLKALPYLSLDEAKVKDVESEGFRELKEENRDLKRELDELSIKLGELDGFAEYLKKQRK
ncbi:site-specific integrase [Methanobacterium sp. CWC-01]|uniref:tyrosine-type recombinase/integrase n=1 Tax=Methanobacterium aridiramus TaxID=2584467 RepID=UPI002578BAAB|nr:tyrosine-type recombinase/integrase [Methanobacterium sp. CWC-01]WJI08814.1 site-specific integrase [Methanobacterium sp. CWC-01]